MVRRQKRTRRVIRKGYMPMVRRPKVEYKLIQDDALVPMSTAGTVIALNIAVRGDDIEEREGREINLRSIEIKAINYAGNCISVSLHRIMLVWDKHPAGVIAGVGDILEQGTPLSMRNLTNRGRFKTLYDKMLTIGHLETAVLQCSGAVATLKYWTKYKRFQLKTVYNSGNAGTIADIQEGALLLLCISDVAAPAALPQMWYHHRIRFVE